MTRRPMWSRARIVSLGLLVLGVWGCPRDDEPDETDLEPGTVTVELTLAELVEPGIETPVVVRAGVVGSDGTVDWSQTLDVQLDITNGTSTRPFGVVDSDGFFESDATLTPGFDLLLVFATATTPEGLSGTATAQADGVQSDVAVVLTRRVSGVYAEAQAAGGGTGQSDSNSDSTDDYAGFEESVSVTVTDTDAIGTATGSATVSQDSLLSVAVDGTNFAGGTVSGLCSASASTTVVPPFDPFQVLGDGNASTGIDLDFTVQGDTAWEFALDGSFTSTPSNAGLPTGGYTLSDTAGCDTVCEGRDYNANQDGESLVLSERVLLPPGDYRMTLGVDCSAAAFGDIASSDTSSSIDFTFSFALPE